MSIQEELNRLNRARVDIKGALDRLGVECNNDKLDGLADALGTIQKVAAKQEAGVITIPVGYISEEQTFVVGSDLSTGYLVNGEDGNVYFQAVKIVDGEAVADGDPVKITGLDIPNIGDIVPVYPPPPSAEAELVTGYIVNNDDGSVYFQRIDIIDEGLGELEDPVKISDLKIVDTNRPDPDYGGVLLENLTAKASDVSAGALFYGADGADTGTMPDVGLSISKNIISVPAGRIREPQEKSISLGKIEREGEKIIVSEGYVEPEVIEFPKSSVNIDGGKITITEGYTDYLQIAMASGYATVDKNQVKINQGFYYDETVTIPYGKAEINEDQTKVIITEGYLDSGEIEIPATENSGGSGGGCEFYKCAAVYGPRKVTYVNVSGAGTSAVNGDYEKTSLKSPEGSEVWKHLTADYYYYMYGDYWCIHSDYSTFWEEALYYAWSGDTSWSPGYDYSTDSLTGAEPAPTVSRRTVTLDADVPKTWDGYKAVMTDGVYIFEDTVTKGLPYGNGYTPTVKKIYNGDATLTVSKVWQGNTFDISDSLFAIDASKGVNDLVNGGSPTIFGDGQEVLRDGEFCFDNARALDYTIGASMSALQDFTIEMDYTITSYNTGYFGFFGNKNSWSTMFVCVQWGRSGYRPTMFSYEYFNGLSGGDEHREWVNDGKYHHVAMVRKGDVITLYSDGIAIAHYSGADIVLNMAIENKLGVGVQHVENAILPGRMKHFRVVPNAVYTEDFSDDIPAWVGA